MIYLETERLILRDYVEDDFKDYYRLKSDKNTMYYLQDIMMSNEDDARVDFNNVLEDLNKDNRKFYFLHIELKETHNQVGSIGYTVEDDTPVGKLVHLGYFSYPKYWNKGYTTEALKRLIEYAFLENNVYRITTGCLRNNVGSEKVMQKCGMIKESELIDYQWHDGEMKTRLEYRLLKHEWNS